MQKILTLLTITAVVGAVSSVSASGQSAETTSKTQIKPNGGYESSTTSESTTPGGGTKTTNKEVDVNVDARGRVDSTVTNTTTTDPKGLLNKQVNNAQTTIEEKTNGGYTQTTTRAHRDANGTSIVYKTVTDVDVDNKGNVQSTVKTEKTVDPKGLMNEKTSSSQTKTVNGKVVETKKESN